MEKTLREIRKIQFVMCAIFVGSLMVFISINEADASDGSNKPSHSEIKEILKSQEGTWLGTELLKNDETGEWRIGNPINLIITRVGELSDRHSYGEDFEFTRHYKAPFWEFIMKDENGDEVVGTKEAISEFSPPDPNGHWRYVTKYTSSPLEGEVKEKMEIAEFSYGTYHKRYFSRPVGTSDTYELYGEFLGRRVR